MSSPVPSAARRYQGRRAGVVTRLVAATVDAAAVLVILFVGYWLLIGLLFMVDPLAFSFPRLSRTLTLSIAAVVTVGYLMLGWTISGRSYGTLIMGLRVVGPEGRSLRPITALIRALACVLFPLGLLWTAVNPRNRSLHDLLLRTSVIYDWRSHLPEEALGSKRRESFNPWIPGEWSRSRAPSRCR